MLPHRDLFYKPGRDEAIALLDKETGIRKETGEKLASMIRENIYRFSHGESYAEQGVDDILNVLRIDGDKEKAEKTALRYMERIQWAFDSQERIKELKKILSEEAEKTPLIILNGYSKKNAPKELKEFFAEYLENDNKAKTKAAAAKKKTAAKKKK